MSHITWIILSIYLLITIIIGLFLGSKNNNKDDYFLAGRRLSGWLAGASMAATTFSIDTPLYVAGLTGNRGLAANWEWWSFGLAHVAMTVIFAPIWRRSGVLTDAAFTELRYGGRTAALLRGVKAFLLAVPVNCIGIGYAFLAMRKVSEALGIIDGHKVFGPISDTVILLTIVAILMLFYTVSGGFWAVVINDSLQLILALIGALVVALSVVNASGGMHQLLVSLHNLGRPEMLSLLPWEWKSDSIDWIGGAGISISSFFAFMCIQWWSFRRSDGGGEFIQRMLATRNEREAVLAGWVFLVINYLIRSWLWIVVALAALVLIPSQQDWELSYPILAQQYLSPIAFAIVVISLVAAFMSTVSTSLNWGSSYLTHDLYQRFIRPNSTQAELLLIGKMASVVLLALGVSTALISESIGGVFRLVIAIGTGPGVVLVLRWFWWRVNAAAELAAMVCGFIVGLTTSVIPVLRVDDYGYKLIITTGLTALVWLIVLLITPPESENVLEEFVRKVRPPGPGWSDLRKRLGIEPADSLQNLLVRFALSSGLLYGLMLGFGAFLLHQELGGWLGLTVAVSCVLGLRRGFLQKTLTH